MAERSINEHSDSNIEKNEQELDPSSSDSDDNDNEDNPLLVSSGRQPHNLTSRDSTSNSEDEITAKFKLIESLEREGDAQTTNNESLMHLLKGNMGTGILAMASAVKNAGLWTGLAGILIIGMIATHCMHLLVNCSHRLCARFGKPSLDYGEVAELAFASGPRRLQCLAKFSKITVNVFLAITQFGFCIVYVLFIADNIKEIVEEYSDWRQPSQVYMVFVVLLLIPFVFIRKLKHLAPFSMTANILTGVGLCIILVYCFANMRPYFYYKPFKSVSTLPLFFGTVVYAFEGIGVALPIENKMKEPKAFAGFTGVLNTGMVIVATLYCALGFYGYLTFGDTIKGSITLNLPTSHWFYMLPNPIFTFAIFISYGVQFYVPATLIIPAIKRRCCSSLLPRYDLLIDYAIRTLFVLFTFAMAAVIPHLDLMISLVGALASSTLALIFPPILEVIVFWDRMGTCRWKVLKNVLICLFGILGFVTGTATTIMEIVKVF